MEEHQAQKRLIPAPPIPETVESIPPHLLPHQYVAVVVLTHDGDRRVMGVNLGHAICPPADHSLAFV